jgi:hypothetical protein
MLRDLGSLVASGAALLLAAACSGGGSSGKSGTGPLKILVTDAPFAHDLVEEAKIHVSAVRVHRDAQADSGFIDLDIGSGLELDLLDLQNGITAELVEAELPVGTYRQIRLVVDEASLTLVNGNVYSTELGNLHLTSTDTSGIKVFVSPPIQVTSTLTTVLLDVDLTKSFHAIPASDPPNATKFNLMPVVRAANVATTGEIRGTVTHDDGTGTQVGVDAATVFLLLPGETDPDQSVASTSTSPDGEYALLGVSPGTYDLLAVKDPEQGSVVGVQVVAANAVTVDLVIQ